MSNTKDQISKSKLYEYFKTFETKFCKLNFIDKEWYLINCGVYSNCKKANIKDKSGQYSEEWYRARMVWSLVQYGYPHKNICVEFTIPKGSAGAKSLNPDIVIFKSENWFDIYEKWDKSKVVPDELCNDFLVFFEAKNDINSIESAVTKQLGEAMKSHNSEQVFGIYFDNQIDLLIFRKEGTNPIKRYFPNKSIDGDGIEKLNLTNRDELISLPTFDQFRDNLTATEDVSKLNFCTNQPIDEDSFSDLLEVINRLQDRLNVSHLQDLIVEFITLKVADEKEVRKNKKHFFEFYVKYEEKNKLGYGSQSFRNRVENLYKKAQSEYKSIFTNREFKYEIKNGSLSPIHGDDEKFLIGLIEVFQKKTILDTQNTNFNQIIFNNFGNNIEKAKEKQFFTPIPIVNAIIKIINPQKNETICDPCSGICDFLAMAFRHIYKNDISELPPADNFYAYDKDSKILKLAELNLVLNGDGNANVYIMDSIIDKLLIDGNYRDIDFSIENYNKASWENKNDELKNLKKFHIVVTNPPFGKGRDLKTGRDNKWDVPTKTIDLYETWQVSGKPSSIDMGVIFLENAYKILEDGGRMGIILSNSIAGVSEWSKVRDWIISKMRIVALFDLPSGTFGETDVSTTVIIAYKPKPNEVHILSEDYEIFVKEVKHVGYTVNRIDRIVIMTPDFVINEETFQREKDINGNDKRLTDLPDLVNEFNEWLNKNKYKYEIIYNAFHGDTFEKWEI